MQRWGTAALSRLFSPVMIAWFAIIGALGLAQVVQTPEILGALRPIHALRLAAALEWYQLFALMGSVLLAVTGAEAIYADMGHFGRRPVALAWYLAALHGLLLNYLGQGAWLLRQGGSIPKDTTPFFGIVPDGWLVPMVVLAAAASVIASQAAISGLFSLTRQAVQLGYLPRLRIVQTSATEQGQIYVPRINLLLCVGCVALVFVFGSSSALAGAYGFAVAGTMLLTSVAFTVVIVVLWRWSPWKVAAFCLLAIPLDLMFLGATITKLPAGHFFTVIIALIAVALLGIWLAGNARLMGLAQRLDMPVSMFAETLAERTDLIRQPRPAVFLQHLPFPPEMGITPTVLLKQVQVTGLRYAPTVVVHFVTDDRPRVPPAERLSVVDHGQDVHSATILGGFAEGLTLAPLIEHGLRAGWWRDEAEIVYFAGREQLRSGTEHALPGWMRAPFRMLHRHDESLARTLRLPASRYVEIGIVIDV
jgi:KUP system potassium uptake protein